MFKDQVYLIGAVEILKRRKFIDFYDLYSGKLNLEDLSKVQEMNIIQKQGLIFPGFIKDIDWYKK